MTRRALAAGASAGLLALAILVPAVRSDTCCANRNVSFVPERAMPGDTVRVEGMVCLAADNSGPLELNLVSFWLAKTDVPARSDPDTVPGEPIGPQAGDLPPVEQWPAFASVSGAGAKAAGSATIVVPQLRSGTYQLWWRCDNGGAPGSGIHYSGGPRLPVGPPDSATVAAPAAPVTAPALPIALLAGALAGIATLRRVARR